MSPNKPPHAGTANRLGKRLQRVYGAVAEVRIQSPLHISKYSEPEPDVVVARGTEEEFLRRHPRGPDCILLIEVCWSSRRRDLRKANLYSAAGVNVYWIIDVDEHRLDVFERPTPEGYSSVRALGVSDEVRLPDSDVVWRVGDLLP